MINPKSVALVFFAVAFGFASVNVQAAPYEFISFPSATFVDKASGNIYHVDLKAYEGMRQEGDIMVQEGEAGVGWVNFQLNGHRLFLTTVGKGYQGPEPPSPFHPLALIKAGGANDQAVDIGARVVEISAHAFVHSDAPINIVFIGPVTVDVRVDRRAGAEHIRVVISSPKGQTKLEGNITP